MNREQVRTAIDNMVNFWKSEGDTDSTKSLRADAFLHLRWWLERVTLDNAVLIMSSHGKR